MNKLKDIVVRLPHDLISAEQHREGSEAIKNALAYYERLKEDYVAIWDIIRDDLLCSEDEDHILKICCLAGTLKDIDLRMNPLTEWAISRSDQMVKRKEKFELVMNKIEKLGCAFMKTEHHPDNKND